MCLVINTYRVHTPGNIYYAVANPARGLLDKKKQEEHYKEGHPLLDLP